MKRRKSPEVYAKRREFMDKYRLEVIGGTLLYCITNQIIHGDVKLLNGDTIAWQGLVSAVIFVIFISIVRGNIAIK